MKVKTHPVSPVARVVAIGLAVKVVHGARRLWLCATRALTRLKATPSGEVGESVPEAGP
jgi:hypothetical protein